MISSIAWVPRGVARRVPIKHQIDKDELDAWRQDAIEESAAAQGSDAEEPETEDAVARARAVAAAITSTGGRTGTTASIEDALAQLDMEHYDDTDEEDNILVRAFGTTMPEDVMEDDTDSSDADDVEIRPSDFVILAGRTEDDVSNLEVWIYEELSDGTEPNMYVHHDIPLPSFPLAMAWLNCDPLGQRDTANMVAIGTMEPGIEIWDLDVVDAIEPVTTLGGPKKQALDDPEKKKKKKKKKQPPKLREGSHEDSVLGLSWNTQFRNVLASASADWSVKVWDVAKAACEHTLRHHQAKVQAVSWNPVEAPVLLSGAFDGGVCLVDARAPQAAPLMWKVSSDVEALTWHSGSPTCFLVSSDDGLVTCFDARGGAGSPPVFRLSAHDKATSCMAFSSGATNLLATGSTDKKVKLWSLGENQPSLLATRDLQVGAVFSVGFSLDEPRLLGAAGAGGVVSVWDVSVEASVAQHFPRLRGAGAAPPGDETEE